MQVINFELALFIFLGLVVVTILSGIRILPKWERAVVYRLGKYHGIKGPGVIWILPFTDRIVLRISMKPHMDFIFIKQALTSDNVSVSIDAVLYYRVVGLEKAVQGTNNFVQEIRLASHSAIRETISKVTLDELRSESEKIGKQLQEIINAKTEEWGVEVLDVEIRNIETLD